MDVEDDLLNEEETIAYINNYLVKKNMLPEYLKQKEYRRDRNILIKELMEKSCLSLRKIAEILELNRETVRRTSVSKEPSP
jgi:predicted HTH domain antitoxin